MLNLVCGHVKFIFLKTKYNYETAFSKYNILEFYEL